MTAANFYSLQMERQIGLTKQSLLAAAVAAYVGAWLIFAIELWWRIQTGSDARMCPAGSQDLTDWCTIGEIAGAYFLVFVWALFGVPFALVLTLLPAMALGQLAPFLEGKLDGHKLNLTLQALGAAAGAFVMLAFGHATNDKSVTTLGLSGLLAGAAGAWAFQKARYKQ